MPFRIVHLSDIHFSSKRDDELIVHTDVRDQLLNDLRTQVPALGSFDSIVVAGDVAFSGKREEYELAAAWLEEVASICNCPTTAVLTVPGNHDVDHDRILPATKMLHRRLRNCSLPDAIHELAELAASDDGSLTDKLTEYQVFASSYGCPFESPSRPHWSRPFSLGMDCSLNFVGLTTVQVCDREDQKGALLLGRNQYIIERSSRIEQIVLMHHPFEWLKDHHEADQYISSRARVLIFGHEHFQVIQKIVDSNNNERLIIGSGALTPPRAVDPFIYRYNLIQFSLEEYAGEPYLAITIHPRVWIPENTRFEADSARLGGRESTTFKLRCPQFCLDAVPTAAAATHDQPFLRIRYFFWRYLDWRQRLEVLVHANVLPHTQHPPYPYTLENLALNRARSENKLGQLWDLVMPLVPPDKREANPYTQ